MRIRHIIAPVCWLCAGMLTWYLSLVIDAFLTYKSAEPTIKMVKKLAPFFVPTTLFVLNHCTDYIFGAAIIAILSWLLEAGASSVTLFLIGATYKPLLINVMMILSYIQNNETASVWTKTVVFQDMVSRLVVFPAIIVATFLLTKKLKNNAQPGE